MLMKTKLFFIAFLIGLANHLTFAQELNLEGPATTLKSDPNVPIFEIKNDAGQTVFAVYPGGVKVFIDDKLKAAGGGFTVGRLGTGKAAGDDYFIVNPGDVQVLLPSTTNKAAGGGFTVGRLGTGKASGTDSYLSVTPDSTRIYTSEKSDKGFAVGRLNTALGAQNFLNLTPNNYFIGHQSGMSNTTGLYNLFLGYQSGFSNKTGNSNTFLGYKSGYSNISGSNNVFLGSYSAYSFALGINNVFIGDSAGFQSSGADYNVFIGEGAGKGNTSGDYNTLIGYQAGYHTGGSSYTTAIGYQAGYSLSDWQAGTYIGFEAGKFNTGRTNVFIGSDAGRSFTTGQDNVCVGKGAGGSNDSPFVEATGARNVFLGWYAGYKCGAAATDNVIVGAQGFTNSITGNRNVLLGSYAGNASAAGSGNVFIGYNAGMNETNSNKLYIDNSSTTTPLIYGDFAAKTLNLNGKVGVNRTTYSNVSLSVSPAGLAYGIYVDAGSTIYAAYFNGSAYTTGTWSGSDIRWKKNIENISSPLEKILQMRGVRFDWNTEQYPNNGFDDKKQIGLIAQEVEKVFPELVRTNNEGYKAVAYDKIAALLIEGMKEQQSQIQSLKQENEKLKVQVSEINKLKSELLEMKMLIKNLIEKQNDFGSNTGQ